MTLAINLVGLLLMSGVVAWFWLWPRRAFVASGNPLTDIASGERIIDITVADGVYTPDVIALQRGESVALRFHRQDTSPCSEHVIFHGLDIDEILPIGGEKTIRITPAQTGTIHFTCQMQMYQGELRVTDAV